MLSNTSPYVGMLLIIINCILCNIDLNACSRYLCERHYRRVSSHPAGDNVCDPLLAEEIWQVRSQL